MDNEYGELPKNKHSRSIGSLLKGLRPIRAIDILKLFSKFEEEVIKIRQKNSITPKKTYDELEKLLGHEEYKLYRKVDTIYLESFDKGLLNLSDKDSNRYHKINEKVREWENKRYPTLNREVGRIRRVILGKIPLSWGEPIKDYILYHKLSIFPADFVRPIPEVRFKRDESTLELHVEIRIYGDTNIALLPNKSFLEALQKELPTYFKIDPRMEENLQRRWLFYLLTKVRKLSYKDANEILMHYGFEPVESQHITQETDDRFANLFVKPKRPPK